MSVDRQTAGSAEVVARAVRRMTPELREQYQVVRKLLSTTTAADARTRYRVGVVVLEIKQSEDRYGTRAVALLASALCRNEATLYRYSAVAEAWTATEVEEILLQRMPGGEPISWCHLQEIAISPREKRESLLRKTIAKGLSLRELTELARGERVKLPHVAGGSGERSRRPLAQLEQLATACEAIEQLAIDDSMLERVLSSNSERAGEIVERTLAAQSKALHQLEQNIAQLRKAAAALPAATKTAALRPQERKFFPRLLCGGTA
jgi:hypothetical protein